MLKTRGRRLKSFTVHNQRHVGLIQDEGKNVLYQRSLDIQYNVLQSVELYIKESWILCSKMAPPFFPMKVARLVQAFFRALLLLSQLKTCLFEARSNRLTSCRLPAHLNGMNGFNNMAPLDFPYVTGPNESNSDIKRVISEGLWNSPFYSCCFSNYYVWEKRSLGQCVLHAKHGSCNTLYGH